MQHIRLIILLFALLQLSRADGVEDLSHAQDEEELSSWDKAESENKIDMKLEDDVEPEQLTDQDEDPLYERKLSPRERLAMEEEERWQRTLEEVEKREREEALQTSESTPELDINESESTEHEQGTTENNYPPEEDEAYAAYLERQRRLNEEESEAAEEDEEVLPVIPGLTDVDLIAFNAEYANEEVLDKIIDWSYDQVADMSRYRDNYIHVEDLYQFLLKTLNPLDEEIDADDEQILTDAVTELRRQQGLVDDEQILYRGFIARGMPLRFLQSLAQEMHQTVQTRRLQASAGRDEL
ncbi:hypothetical protein F441_04013 [Phytophthora nicotianae CJ01A1]|uniref:RxLR effector protein n=2 Tax=Phytophthora nicotianae TaxID=4792 RepID=W2JKW1_PHYNI|nr:hypothetical protein L915_03916 [Phytophthora nicotianae]ETL46233.1 hypothetical protein L916_03860 [Phytophthora nicotianae]ETP22754.1 hypothetical protein F441_04013 [Phytophthora nicotianae CJ01A1]